MSLIREIEPGLPEEDQYCRKNLNFDASWDLSARIEKHEIADVVERAGKEQKRYE